LPLSTRFAVNSSNTYVENRSDGELKFNGAIFVPAIIRSSMRIAASAIAWSSVKPSVLIVVVVSDVVCVTGGDVVHPIKIIK
jgi:hypothetical protein